jgi:hypothetical protein
MAAQPQSDVQREVPAAAEPGARSRDEWEFLWRFIAVAMLIETGWVIWVAIQINPTPIALPAAYEAAARALATRNVEGNIKGADPAPPREPPVNVEKLKFSESIETPIPERPATSATQREQ